MVCSQCTAAGSTAGGQHLAQAGPLAVGTGDPMVDVDPLERDAEGGQCLPLGGEVLPVGADPGVADLDCAHGGSVPG